MKIIFTLITGLLLLGSCTNITVSKQPGKPLSEFPSFMQGEFELSYPEMIQSMIPEVDSLGQSNRSIVKFDKTHMIMINKGEETSSTINDSIAVCKIGKDFYFCFGKAPEISVLKIKQNDSKIELFPMYVTTEVNESDLKKYFKKVELGTSDDESGMSTSYVVEINPKKLKAYFDSETPSKDPFVLTRK